MAFYSISCDDLGASLRIDSDIIDLLETKPVRSNFEKELSIISKYSETIVRSNELTAESVGSDMTSKFTSPNVLGVGAELDKNKGNNISTITTSLDTVFKDNADVNFANFQLPIAPERDTQKSNVNKHEEFNKISNPRASNNAVVLDPALNEILLKDEMVSLMSSELNCSRDECLFYLESKNYDLEKAIAMYRGFAMD